MPAKKNVLKKKKSVISGKIFVISGPSGSGKTTLANAVLQDARIAHAFTKSISFTTRKKRPGECDKKDYFFITESQFFKRRKAKKILEWTRYLSYYYGTDKEFVEDKLRFFSGIILCLDVRGALRIKRMYPKRSRIIFVKPPSIQELYRRIEKRCRLNPQEVQKRLETARKEMTFASQYDYRIVNKDLGKAIAALKKILIKNF